MLKRLGLVVCAITLATIAATAQQNGGVRKAARPAPGRYIVILNSSDDPEGLGLAMARLHGGRLSHVFRAAAKGFAINLPEAAAQQLARDPRVRLVEEDSIVSVSNVQNGVYWGLDRIDQRTLPLDERYFYPAGSGTVHVHIIDTGIRATHVEFGGRAHVAADYVDDDRDNDPNDIGDDDGVPGPDGADCHGHGTHVAGTVGGETYGVAKSAALWGYRVLDCSGNGFTSSVIAAVDAITASTQRPAAVNVSLTAGSSQALDEAVRRSISSGVTYVIAAGNDNIDAATVSPARVTEAITVGASDSYDVRAGFSNYGAVVDLFAPGLGITSAWGSSDLAMAALSGTSMASPHVAGVAALYLQAHPTATPEQVRNALVAAASPVITSAGTGSPNLLIYSGFLLPSDLNPPVVSITAPSPNSVVTGTLSLSATATDNTAVAGVQFKLNGSNIGTSVSGPGPTFTSTWNSATVTDGPYTISVVAIDAAGNTGTSSVAVIVRNTFPPVISALTVSGVTSSSAVVSWTTDKPATSQVAWGIASASTLTPIDSALVTAHSVILSGLAPSTTYRYVVRSSDAQGALATSAELTFTTSSAGGQAVPIGYWAFEDGSGPTAADTSGSGNHGTLTGATFTPGKLAGGVTFSGNGQYMAAAGNNNTTFTTTAWFRTTGPVGTWSGLIEYSTTSGLRRGMALDPTARPVVTYGAAYRAATGPRLDDGAWHHLAASYDGITATVYVDGQPVGLGAASPAGSTSASRLRIGDLAFPGYYFKGVIDDVRLYDRALPPADITAIYTDTGTPADTEAPSVPSGLSATAISSTQINLAWTASTDNVAVTGYRIFRNGIQVATVTGTQHADSGLAPATPYSYTVAATDAAGNRSTASTAAGATTLAPPETTPPVTGLIGDWAFEDGSGPTAADTSGTGNHGTLTGATFTAGKLAGGVTFSGNGQYLAAAGNNNTTFTTTAWFRTTGPVGTWSGLIEYSTTSGLRRGMALDPTGRPVVAYGAAAYRVATGPRLDDGAWHHLAASYDGTTARVYVDGQPVGLGAASPAGSTSTSRLRIGDLAFPGYYFKGVIDEVRLYDRALSAADITAIYADVGTLGGQ